MISCPKSQRSSCRLLMRAGLIAPVGRDEARSGEISETKGEWSLPIRLYQNNG